MRVWGWAPTQPRGLQHVNFISFHVSRHVILLGAIYKYKTTLSSQAEQKQVPGQIWPVPSRKPVSSFGSREVFGLEHHQFFQGCPVHHLTTGLSATTCEGTCRIQTEWGHELRVKNPPALRSMVVPTQGSGVSIQSCGCTWHYSALTSASPPAEQE